MYAGTWQRGMSLCLEIGVLLHGELLDGGGSPRSGARFR
jgi:hypothetical protein